LIDKGFAELGVERVTAQTMAVHVALRRVMERSGLRFVRTFHADWPVLFPAMSTATSNTHSIGTSGNPPVQLILARGASWNFAVASGMFHHCHHLGGHEPRRADGSP